MVKDWLGPAVASHSLSWAFSNPIPRCSSSEETQVNVVVGGYIYWELKSLNT